MLVVTPRIHIAEDELSERFTRARGPGGQHVNRTESAVELRFNAAESDALPEPVRERLLARQDRRVTAAGLVIVRAERFRDQARNRDDARQRLAELIREATHTPTPRRPTKPSRAARQRRLDSKKRRGQRKRTRGRDWRDD